MGRVMRRIISGAIRFAIAPYAHERGRKQMIDVHYWTTPNGHKITMFLEEPGLPYKLFPVRIGAGEQFKPSFLKISPNNRIPAIVDNDPPERVGIPFQDLADKVHGTSGSRGGPSSED